MSELIFVVNYCTNTFFRYNNLNAVLLFIPAMIVFGEVGSIASSPDLFNQKYWVLMTIAGIFGLAVELLRALHLDYRYCNRICDDLADRSDQPVDAQHQWDGQGTSLL